ncbi:alpha/beta hydrolase family protein [Solitalea koreensis]|uniref:Xaa-Pro dipeptidyl-peptidase-like domain-containing protein n=1 Tax=Solitalea koreensis TaxID=543615 RepID=A0A521D7Q0_9SPHI|nr:alpha/beta fold hydrolase [Solitalea koreensis]SMO67736.1 hypothetical protein SAMN06265350_10638 [Solitalea koreensis]
MLKKLIFFTSIIFLALNTYSQSANISGDWFGRVDLGISLRLAFHISEQGNAFKATMDSPDQKAFGIAVDKITINNDTLQLSIERIGFNYVGVVNKDFQQINGKLSQGSISKELNLSRSEVKKDAANRPQEPKPPFEYVNEDISFHNTKDSVTLSGTFSHPSTSGKYPVLVLISGSGPQDRDETMADHKPFLVIADYLVKNGFAVLRYDDRGFGKSTGSFANSSLYNFAEDAKAAVRYLKTRNDVDQKNIGLIGHSEGGYIAPMIAAQSKDIAYIVLLAGPGIKGSDVILTQNRLIRAANHTPEERINQESDLIKNCTSITASGSKKNNQQLRTQFEAFWNLLSPIEQQALGSKEAFVESRTEIWTAPWYSDFIHFDPSIYLQKVKCPVLAMNGTKDLQVEYQSNLEALSRNLSIAKNKHCTFAAMEGLNHLFQTATTGTIDEYEQIEETFSPKALKLMSDWLKQEIK